MKRIYLLFVIVLLPQLVFSKWLRTGYNELTIKNFRSYSAFNQRIDEKNVDYPLLNAAVFYATNEIRIKHGRKFLEYAPELEKAAWLHSKDMVEKNFFSHKNPYDSKKRTPEQRGRLAGIKNPKIAENIASGFGIDYRAGRPVYKRGPGKFSYTPSGRILPNHTYLSLADALVKQWMNSPGHRRNILSRNGQQLGCGVYFFRDRSFNNMLKCKATQNFQWFFRVKSRNQ
jgi:uncharacterized protein YkwD